MDKIQPSRPLLLMLYGVPGAGKTFFARQFCDTIQAAHLEQDRIRHELFEHPRYTKQENFALNRILDYMSSEFLTAGISVVMDYNAMRISQRRQMRELARQHKAATLIVWFQVDNDTAFIRNNKRDRDNNTDDKYAVGYEEEQFNALMEYMQPPEPTEDYIVVSGKHNFSSQISGVIRKLNEMQVIKYAAASKKMIRPELVNNIPKQQKDGKNSRRNIVLR